MSICAENQTAISLAILFTMGKKMKNVISHAVRKKKCGTFVFIYRDSFSVRFHYGPTLALFSLCHQPIRDKILYGAEGQEGRLRRGITLTETSMK